jgi:hypothetical protein
MRRSAATLAAAAIALAGCGGSASDDAKSAVKDYVNAFVNGDGHKACSLMTAATRQQFVKRSRALTKTTDCASAIEAIRTQAGQAAMGALKKVTFSDPHVAGDTATVKLTSSTGTSTAFLKKEGGSWKVSGVPGAQ